MPTYITKSDSPVPLNFMSGMLRVSCKKGPLDKYDLYNKHGIPDRFHYKNNERVTDIVLVAKEGYAFGTTFFQVIHIQYLLE